MIAVTVYTKPACPACDATQRHLKRRDIPYIATPIESDDNIGLAISYLGFTSAPVVCASTSEGEQAWSGYRPDRIDALKGQDA